MSHEQPPFTSEQKYPRWEMQLSWGDLVAGLLERKVIQDDDPNYPEWPASDFAVREFKTSAGEKIETWMHRVSDETEIAGTHWSLAITSTNSTQKHLLYIDTPPSSAALGDDSRHVYVVGSEIPLPDSSVESLIGTIATMQPTGPTEYGREAYSQKLSSAYR